MSNQLSPMFYQLGKIFFVFSVIVFILDFVVHGNFFESLIIALPLVIYGIIFMSFGGSFDAYYHSEEFKQKRIENLKELESEWEDED